jgi:hypothetical protein
VSVRACVGVCGIAEGVKKAFDACPPSLQHRGKRKNYNEAPRGPPALRAVPSAIRRQPIISEQRRTFISPVFFTERTASYCSTAEALLFSTSSAMTDGDI